MSLASSNATTVSRADRRWEEAMDEHREALAAFLDTAGDVGEAEWGAPWKPGKWTRAQVVEHVLMAYETCIRELETGEGMALKLTPFRRKLTRWILLPHILFHRSFPLRAPAPREIRPKEPRAPKAEVLRQLRERGERFEAAMERAMRAGGGSLTHPFFGSIPPLKALRFIAVHTEHHRRQIARKGR